MACESAKITAGVGWALLIIVLVVLLILFLTKVLTFGKSSTPSDEQVVQALRNGVTITDLDVDTQSEYQTTIQLRDTAARGVDLKLVSKITAAGVELPDIGGDSLLYRVGPQPLLQAAPGVIYDIANTATGRQVYINSKMQVVPPPVPILPPGPPAPVVG
ncbi:Hypothetical protein POVN_LOCUS658 [uncultured virus]|nr:Hypothetical protein POVN_LOCUS658 [uncultured virus]